MLTEEKIREIAGKIALKTDALKIVLFGSYARGAQRPDSDLDLLVVVHKTDNPREQLIQLKKGLISKDYSLDIILLSESEYLRQKTDGWRIFDEIDASGRVIYAA